MNHNLINLKGTTLCQSLEDPIERQLVDLIVRVIWCILSLWSFKTKFSHTHSFIVIHEKAFQISSPGFAFFTFSIFVNLLNFNESVDKGLVNGKVNIMSVIACILYKIVFNLSERLLVNHI